MGPRAVCRASRRSRRRRCQDGTNRQRRSETQRPEFIEDRLLLSAECDHRHLLRLVFPDQLGLKVMPEDETIMRASPHDEKTMRRVDIHATVTESREAYEIGDEVWALADAIADQSQIVADGTGAGVLERPERTARIGTLIVEMTAALVRVGDRYRSPDGVLCSLTDVASEPDSAVRVGAVLRTPRPQECWRSCASRMSRWARLRVARPRGVLERRSDEKAVPGGHTGALEHLPSGAGHPRGRVLDHRCPYHCAGAN